MTGRDHRRYFNSRILPLMFGWFWLIDYFEYHKNKEVVTYDDVANKITYFYGKETEKVA